MCLRVVIFSWKKIQPNENAALAVTAAAANQQDKRFSETLSIWWQRHTQKTICGG